MRATIYAPGIRIEITDPNKVNIVCDMIDIILDTIFYDTKLKNDVMTIHDKSGDCIVEAILKPNPENGIMKGFSIRNKWYCLPDAKDSVHNIITEIVKE